MEDLKKQTALRLALEQQQTRHFSSSAQQKKNDSEQHQQTQSYHGHGSTNHPQNCDVQFRQVHVSPRQHMTENSNPYVSSEMSQGNILYSHSSSTSSSGHAPESNNLNHRQRQRQPQQQPVSNAKSKLPHGLTVQELKEMTKARLQAEAAELHDKDFPGTPPNSTRSYQQSPHQQHFQQQSSVRDGSREGPCDSTYSDQRAVPASNSSTMGFNKDRILQPSSSSQSVSGPPGFQSYASQGSLSSPGIQGRDSWHQQQHAKETWETGSVASHNSTINSEYLGRESPYTPDEVSEMPFNRTLSYPSGNLGLGNVDRNFENPTHVSVGGGSYFDNSGLNANRRRASTLSPRQGLSNFCELSPRTGLSNLHENQASSFGGTIADLSIPFDPKTHNHTSLRQSPESVLREKHNSRNFNVNSITSNRPRTSSAPSVSTFVSNEMFGDTALSGRGLYGNNVQSKSLVERILGDSSNARGEHADFSSVFRSTSQDQDSDQSGLNPWGSGPGSLKTGSFPGDGTYGLSARFDSVLSVRGIQSSPKGSLSQLRDPEVSLFPSLSGDGAQESYRPRHDTYGSQSFFAREDIGLHEGDRRHGL